MNKSWVKLVTATFLGAAWAAMGNASPAFAIRFNFFSEFTEEGAFPGGSLIGTLAGEDLNNDNFLKGTEITDFFARFKSNDEEQLPSFIQEGTEAVGGSSFGVGSERGNYDFATVSIEDGGSFGAIEVLLGGGSDSNALTVVCVDAPPPARCSSLPFEAEEVFIEQNEGITLVQVPEPSATATLMGLAVLSLVRLRHKSRPK